MTPARRKPLLLLMLALSAALVAWDQTRGAGLVVAASKPAARPAPAAPAPRPGLVDGSAISALRVRDDYKDEAADAFGTAPQPASPAPVAQELPPAAPVAPPLPFTVIGKKFDAGVWEVYLTRGDHTYIVTKGSMLDSDYRVGDISATQLSLVYLPLNEKQALPLGATFHD